TAGIETELFLENMPLNDPAHINALRPKL
ncbi:MAG: hypothetical protein K0R82_2810, partial [Flavipsychrobacter sp.]|nr:hypothetical protein [Flavipsychrobacter sp.]